MTDKDEKFNATMKALAGVEFEIQQLSVAVSLLAKNCAAMSLLLADHVGIDPDLILRSVWAPRFSDSASSSIELWLRTMREHLDGFENSTIIREMEDELRRMREKTGGLRLVDSDV